MSSDIDRVPDTRQSTTGTYRVTSTSLPHGTGDHKRNGGSFVTKLNFFT